MKTFVIAAALALACVQSAAAQPAVLVKSKPISGTVPDITTEFPAKVLRWVDAETERQFAAPTSLYDLELAMLMELEPELQRIAKKQHLSFDETCVLIMSKVVLGAAKKMDKSVHARREAVEKAGIPDKQDAELRSLGARKAGLLTLINELGPRMTNNTRMLTADKGPDLANMGARGK
jgi:hypothetical protein